MQWQRPLLLGMSGNIWSVPETGDFIPLLTEKGEICGIVHRRREAAP